jgi:Ni/Co efflux regulator RcnB
MRKTVLTILGAFLVAGSMVQMATASDGDTRKPHRKHVAASTQFRAASNAIEGDRNTSCSHEAGNPYNKETDYAGWSAWRLGGGWDSRNACQ